MIQTVDDELFRENETLILGIIGGQPFSFDLPLLFQSFSLLQPTTNALLVSSELVLLQDIEQLFSSYIIIASRIGILLHQ